MIAGREKHGSGEKMEVNGVCCVKSSGGWLPSDFDGEVITVRRKVIVFMKETELDSNRRILRVWGVIPQEYGVARIPLVDAVIGRFSDNVGIVGRKVTVRYDGIHVAIEGYDANSRIAYRFAINPDVLKLVDADKLFMIINDFAKRAGAEKAQAYVVERVLTALTEYAVNTLSPDDLESCIVARIPKRIGRSLNPLWVLCEAVRLARLMA